MEILYNQITITVAAAVEPNFGRDSRTTANHNHGRRKKKKNKTVRRAISWAQMRNRRPIAAVSPRDGQVEAPRERSQYHHRITRTNVRRDVTTAAYCSLPREEYYYIYIYI